MGEIVVCRANAAVAALAPRRKLLHTIPAADVSSSLEEGEPVLEAVKEKRRPAVPL